MANEKQVLPKDVAIAVLKKAEEVLKKSEVLEKYASENRKKLGYKPSELGAQEKDQNDDDANYEVEAGSAKNKKRVKKQIDPDKNPKEKAEGNNKPDGMEPEYEFKDKVGYELNKEKLGKVENNSGFLKTEDFTELYGDLEALSKAQAPMVGLAAAPTPAPAPAMPEAQASAEPAGAPNAYVPAVQIGSAKLAKFMERVYAKRKARNQAPAAASAGQAPAGAPAGNQAPIAV